MSMFVILREKSGAVFDDALMNIYELAGFVESEVANLAAIRKEFGDGLLIAEEITMDFERNCPAIPGELDRAIDEWNARIVGKLKFAKKEIRARGHYVKPFRKWKRELGTRDYFLWQLIDDLLTATDFTKAWMRFGLFFAKKDGEYHSDLFRAGHYRDPNYRAPEPEPEIVVLDFADRVRMHQRRAWDLISNWGDPDKDARARAQFNSRAEFIAKPISDAGLDRWDQWKAACAKVPGTHVRFEGIGA